MLPKVPPFVKASAAHDQTCAQIVHLTEAQEVEQLASEESRDMSIHENLVVRALDSTDTR